MAKGKKRSRKKQDSEEYTDYELNQLEKNSWGNPDKDRKVRSTHTVKTSFL